MNDTANTPTRDGRVRRRSAQERACVAGSAEANCAQNTEASGASGESLGKALARAPMEDEEIDADELRAIREGLDDRRAGRVVTTRELERELGN